MIIGLGIAVGWVAALGAVGIAAVRLGERSLVWSTGVLLMLASCLTAIIWAVESR
jgi:hypothetical protein